MILRADNSRHRPPRHPPPGALAGDSGQSFTATANAANQVQALSATGFQLGTDDNVNESAVNIYALALKDLP